MVDSPRVFRSIALSIAMACVAGIPAVRPGAESDPPGVSSKAMAAAANQLLTQLTPERRAKAVHALESKEHADWHFVPRDRPGLSFGAITDADRIAARALVRTGLSGNGVLKVEAIMALENVLRDLENDNPVRDPGKYAITVFGSPENSDGGWGWRLEGHHLCLNFTCARGDVVSVTPMFLGSNPGEARAGLVAGMRALAAEEDVARALVMSLSDSQRAKAVIDERAPADVLTMPGRPMDGIWDNPALGLAASELSAQQRLILDELVSEFAHNLRGELAAAELARMHESGPTAGKDTIRFCWAGGVEKGQPHYYRIVGPTFVIEYDHTQNNANHVHTVWHDRTRDLGGDLLGEHLGREHGRDR